MDMNLIESMFSPGMLRVLETAGKERHTGIQNVARELAELVVAGLYCVNRGNILWVVGENENLREKRVKLKLWLDLLIRDKEIPPIHFYTIPFEDPYINNEDNEFAIGNKAKLISELQSDRRFIVITTLPALNLKLESREHHGGFFLELGKNRDIGRDRLIKQLTGMGYRSRNIVEERGDVSWRGSIVDVFPIDAEFPVRIEIEGDIVVSIRVFNPDSQKSLKRIDEIVFPVSRFYIDYSDSSEYFAGDHEEMHDLISFLGDYRLVVSDLKRTLDEFQKLLNNYEKIYELALEKDPGLKPPGELFTFDIEKERLISIDETWDNISARVEWESRKKSVIDLNIEDIGQLGEKVAASSSRLYVCATDKKVGENLAMEADIKTVHTLPFKIPCSFENPHTGSIFLADKTFQYVEKIDRVSQLKSDNLVKEIQVGDMVVHRKHGIGKFIGFKKLGFEGHISEFLKIEYLKSEYLYVPVYELDVLSKYVAFEGSGARMDRLGGNSWASKQSRARKSIINFARELLELYAMRKAIKGSVYPRDAELEEKLEAGFQFVETEDQKRAIKDVLADLEAEFPMDRLICGDVSFGKTEVALRAAFRVVSNGKQVVVLCPTTILAYQHYTTFTRRLSNFPISVGMLSRMVTGKQKKEIYQQLKDGKLDIVIGTHSLLSKDLEFKRLGLYVIDEEQRFGVFQKEKLKQSREDIDTLSMSATPIPRTLSLSMAGLQDISSIQTPPLGRRAVKNFVGYFSREIIMSAILNEIERDGSVFIVYNNIEKIYSFQEELRKWLPQVPTAVIHAKMKTQEIEPNLMAFIDKKYRVLISTTIIENGIDIPNVNTLLILDADRFGLTQLYQLRGRIGRGNRQAYAYFLVKTMDLSEKAKARLDAIRDFADLGSGYKLAEFDLKLRGAGSLLGNRQHGHIEALGFDYYHQMLSRTIKELKGELEVQAESKVTIHFSYSIDPEYIKHSGERITLYRKILEAKSFEDLDDLRAEITDRYGKPPGSIEKIFFAGTIRLLVRKWKLEEVDVYIDNVVMKFPDAAACFERKGKRWQKGNISLENIHLEIIDHQTQVFHFPEYKAFIRQLTGAVMAGEYKDSILQDSKESDSKEAGEESANRNVTIVNKEEKEPEATEDSDGSVCNEPIQPDPIANLFG
jgi:transcription-repair coupling factor (superfamily II helicase)